MAHYSFAATYLLAAALIESHRVHSILDSGAYNGYPMESDWREGLVARQKLESGMSHKFHQGGAHIRAG